VFTPRETELKHDGSWVDELKKKWFFWGVVLAWAPWLPILVGLGHALLSISSQKATGIGVVAGGLNEIFVVWGIGAIVIGQVIAIALLFRAFAPGHWLRSLFSMLCICLSAMMLVLVGLFLWLSWFQAHHSF
jgi:hypothetical protein